MAQTPLFQDPERDTALTLRVMYDGHQGLVSIASALHARDETPERLAVLRQVRVDRSGWWAVQNAIRDELQAYAALEEARTLGTTPF